MKNLLNTFFTQAGFAGKLLILAITLTIMSCSGDDGPNTNNPNLPNIGVNLTLDLNLPEYNQLNFPGNTYVTTLQGIRGIVVFNIDNSQYTAFEISDPNHPPNDCSAAQVVGLTATCSCSDENAYNIVTGQITNGEGQYPLKAYRITRSGDQLIITN